MPHGPYPAPMRLFVCWGTFGTPLHTHACASAHEALREAGHDHEVVRARSLGPLPGFLQTAERKEVREHTGSSWVPALELDDGTWIGGSERIVAWARQNPA